MDLIGVSFVDHTSKQIREHCGLWKQVLANSIAIYTWTLFAEWGQPTDSESSIRGNGGWANKKYINILIKERFMKQIFVFSVITLILLTACSSQTPQKMLQIKEKAVSTGNVDYCDTIQSSSMNDECRIDVAVKTKNPQICEKVYDTSSCYSQVSGSMQAKDSTLCDKIPSGSDKTACLSGVAGRSGDISFCDQITYSRDKDRCIWGVVKQNKNTALCEGIKDAIDKDWCLKEK